MARKGFGQQLAHRRQDSEEYREKCPRAGTQPPTPRHASLYVRSSTQSEKEGGQREKGRKGVGIKGSENGFGEPERRLIAKKAKREETKKGQRRVKKASRVGGRAEGRESIRTGRGEEGKKLARPEEEGASKERNGKHKARACDRPLGSACSRRPLLLSL